MCILALIDFSDVTDLVIRTAEKVARAEGGKLYLLHIAFPDAEYDGKEIRENRSREGAAAEIKRTRQRMQEMQSDLEQRGSDVTAMVVRGTSIRANTAEKVLEEMERLKPEMVVVGSHGRSALYNLLVGTVTQAVIRHASCPVVVIPRPAISREKAKKGAENQ